MSLITRAPLAPATQFWYTADVPADGGVYPVSVFAPALPPLFAREAIVVLGEPPRLSEPVPEPSTALLFVATALLVCVMRRRQ